MGIGDRFVQFMFFIWLVTANLLSVQLCGTLSSRWLRLLLVDCLKMERSGFAFIEFWSLSCRIAMEFAISVFPLRSTA